MAQSLIYVVHRCWRRRPWRASRFAISIKPSRPGCACAPPITDGRWRRKLGTSWEGSELSAPRDLDPPAAGIRRLIVLYTNAPTRPCQREAPQRAGRDLFDLRRKLMDNWAKFTTTASAKVMPISGESTACRTTLSSASLLVAGPRPKPRFCSTPSALRNTGIRGSGSVGGEMPTVYISGGVDFT